jgi:tetratricopeptide (TPR) repeat protein
MRDVLALYADVSEAIAKRIHAKIERPTTAARRAVDPEAWELYSRGRHFWGRVSADNLEKAREYFQQAIDKQADFAAAYAGLADTYLLLAVNRVLSPLEAIPRARTAALKALELDDMLADAHTTLAGIACTFDADWSAAERGYRRAFELNPSYATAHQHWKSIPYRCELVTLLGRVCTSLAGTRTRSTDTRKRSSSTRIMRHR